VNIGKKGTRATVGLPGTGISYSEKLSGQTKKTIQHDQSSIAGTDEGGVMAHGFCGSSPLLLWG
jgi:hypothetical protein